jgi:hypothetical protein
MTFTQDRKRLVEKLAGLIRLQRTAALGMQTTLARERAVWIEDNIPPYMEREVWAEALDKAGGIA